MPGCIVFDVNETLLDLSGLDAAFLESFGDAAVRRDWFAALLRTGMAATIVGLRPNFGEVGAASLNALAVARSVALSDRARTRILDGMRNLPPHADVPDALARLQGAGLRIAALTNSPSAAATAQIANAGIAPFFEAVLSVEEAGSLKPDTVVYRYALDRLGLAPADMWMVAAHDWDIAGAMAAGCNGAFVARGGAFNAIFPPPTVSAADMGTLAERLVAALAS